MIVFWQVVLYIWAGIALCTAAWLLWTEHKNPGPDRDAVPTYQLVVVAVLVAMLWPVLSLIQLIKGPPPEEDPKPTPKRVHHWR